MIASMESATISRSGDTASKPKIREIVSLGNARSFYQMKSSNAPADQPSINYVVGRIIDILFETGKVATVTVTDKATGVLIEPATASTSAKPAATTTPQTGQPARTPAPAPTQPATTPTPVKPAATRP